MSKRLGGIIGCKDKTSSCHRTSSPMVVTLGDQYNVGEKLTVILSTYINRHAGPPNKTKRFCIRKPMIPPKRFDIFPPD